MRIWPAILRGVVWYKCFNETHIENELGFIFVKQRFHIPNITSKHAQTTAVKCRPEV